VSEQTYYRWRREYGGLNTTQAKKRVVDISLDNAILKDVLSKK
jgi:hypothetical protein